MLSSARRRTLLDLIHSDLSLRCLLRRERVALGTLCLCLLVLLAALQHGRVFFGDEIATLRCAAAMLLLLLTYLNGVYTVAFLVLLVIAESVSAGVSVGRKFLWEARTLWIPLAGVAIIVGAAYWRLLPDIARVDREWGTDTPPTSKGYIPQVFTTFMGVGRAALLSMLLLLAACWSAIREKRALQSVA